MAINGPLDLGLWRDKLKADVAALRKVGLAADLLAAQTGLKSSPQAFVVPVSDTPVSRAGSGNTVVSQNVTAVVAIVILVRNKRKASTGAESSLDLNAIRSSIMDSLIGWQPAGADSAIQFAGGRSLDFSASGLFWSDRYTSSYFVRKEYTT